jgi:hypothetical protein
MIYQFYDPDGCCLQYFINAKSKEEASEKFIIWQNKALPKTNQWPEDIVKNLDNFQKADDYIFFIGFDI